MSMPNRNHFPNREAKERIKDFKEVSGDIPLKLALKEAERCLNCSHAPCVSGCPVNIQIPKFIQSLKQGKIKEAYQIIRHDNFLPSVCGRVCPQEKQCEQNCVLNKKFDSVAIGKLEKFLGDKALEEGWNKATAMSYGNKKVAIAGSGPASLACAGELAKNGVKVSIFEALHKIGGVLSYGIPEFRLPKSIIEKETKVLNEMGVEFILDTVIGKTLSIQDILEDYDALFLGVGSGYPRFLNVPGETLNGVFSSNEFLTRINLMNAYDFPNYDTPVLNAKKVIVVGGGNTAMDAARNAVRLGAKEVHIVYRRSANELPARKEEVTHATEEGVEFNFLLNPIEIFGDENGNVSKVQLQKMRLTQPDENGKRRPVKVAGEQTQMSCDMLIIAIGTLANPLLASSDSRLEVDSGNHIVVDKDMQTSIQRVYAGGDIVTGAATVIEALGAGKKAALNILKNLRD